MRITIIGGVVALCVFTIGCAQRQPDIEFVDAQELKDALKAEAAAKAAADGQPSANETSGQAKAGYVQVPGLKLAVLTDDRWKNQFIPSRGGQAWPRWNERGVTIGSIHFLVMPKFFPSVQEEAEAGHAEMKKLPLFTKDGSHFQPLTIDGRSAYVTSYHGKVGQKKLYTMQVTMEYDDKQRLLLSCAYEQNLSDDISEELLKKVQEIRFVPE